MICAAESINCIILFIHITFFNTSVMFHVELSTLFNNEHQTIIMSTDKHNDTKQSAADGKEC